jgi:hypothetical protein
VSSVLIALAQLTVRSHFKSAQLLRYPFKLTRLQKISLACQKLWLLQDNSAPTLTQNALALPFT